MIKLHDLIKEYGGRRLLKGVTLELSPDEIVAVIGPSGCGKTTLLRLIAGFEGVDGGSISIDGQETNSLGRYIPPHRRNLSMVFQDLALWPHLTVGEHIGFALGKERATSKDLKKRIATVLAEVSLNGYVSRYPHELSGGEKQRLAIARAIAPRPRYLLMDEPFSNLDPILKDELQKMVQRLREDHHLGIIYVTHIMEEVLVLADRIAVMNEGRFVQVDYKERLLREPKNEFVRRMMCMSLVAR